MLKNKNVGLVLFEVRRTILESIGKNGEDIFALLLEQGYNVFTLDGRMLTPEELEHPADADYLAAVNPEVYIPHLGTSTAPVI
ncbi:MAG TPA: hypothetical protein D7H92_01030 [Candidatus Poseidoniales archaeon]|nr:MAG TPA: hypothetical protein D7H92_01030 [Candidatus Poseidoniales archaeon]